MRLKKNGKRGGVEELTKIGLSDCLGGTVWIMLIFGVGREVGCMGELNVITLKYCLKRVN